MTGGLIVPAAMLALALLGATAVWRLDARQKQLGQRVASMCGGTGAVQGRQTRNIRRDDLQRSALLRSFAVILRLPVNLPQAHVLPVWLVPAVALLAGAGGFWVACQYLPVAAAALAGLGVATAVARSLFGWEVDRYRAGLVSQIPDVIDLVAGAVRSGLPAAEAFRSAARDMPAPTSGEFAQVVNEISLGTAPADALMQVHRRTNVTEYAIFSVTLAIQSRSGGRLAETIENLADTVRQRIAIAARAKALAGEAKLSANILSVLPVVAGALMSALQPGFLTPLFEEPQGRRLLAIGVCLLILGTVIMRHMIKGVTRE